MLLMLGLFQIEWWLDVPLVGLSCWFSHVEPANATFIPSNPTVRDIHCTWTRFYESVYSYTIWTLIKNRQIDMILCEPGRNVRATIEWVVWDSENYIRGEKRSSVRATVV